MSFVCTKRCLTSYIKKCQSLICTCICIKTQKDYWETSKNEAEVTSKILGFPYGSTLGCFPDFPDSINSTEVGSVQQFEVPTVIVYGFQLMGYTYSQSCLSAAGW